MRINNLYNLHKKRNARISDDSKSLFVEYELDQPHGVKNSVVQYTVRSRQAGRISVAFQKGLLNVRVELPSADKNKLYRIFLIIAYLLGQEITLFYKYSNFPYYDIPHYFNFGDYPFSSGHQAILINDAKKAIDTGLRLLEDEYSIFKILPYMLEVNAIPHAEIRFFSEYSLLEHLAGSTNLEGRIFAKRSAEFVRLKAFSAKIKRCIGSETLADTTGIFKDERVKKKIEKIVKSLSVGELNIKGVDNDKIKAYILTIGLQNKKPIIIPPLKTYYAQADAWAELRNRKGLAHGNVLKIKADERSNKANFRIMKSLHDFLSLVFYREFQSNL